MDKAENHMKLDACDLPALVSWKSLHGFVSTVNTVHRALHKYRLKLYHAHDTETLLSSLGQSSFKVD